MSNEMIILISTTAIIGFTHTIAGPDHYLPFIVLAKARKWSLLKTLVITFLCGLGHVASSIILGIAGIGLGIAVFKLESIEAFRGDIAGWILIIFGFTYLIWAIRHLFKNKIHSHTHAHKKGIKHEHLHSHVKGHTHEHVLYHNNLTLWTLFIIFILGPCEPLIPLVMYPAAKGSFLNVVLVSAVFGLITITTMLVIVATTTFGFLKVKLKKFEKYSHVFAGAIIFISGFCIKFLGL